MIPHSRLTQALMRLPLVAIRDVPKYIEDAIKLTRAGVLPEGSKLDMILIPIEEYNRLLSQTGPVKTSAATLGDSVHAMANNGESIAPARAVDVSSGFKFGPASEKELVGVKTALVEVARLALDICEIDFCVFDGIRSIKEQQTHVKNGTSKTMKSKHLDGLALDLVPWISGKPVWDWDGCYKIAHAMDLAATQLGVADHIIWGGAWDRRLSDFGGDVNSYRRQVEEYKSRHPGPDFIDGPHFEWVN